MSHAQPPTSDLWTVITALATLGLFLAACAAGLIAQRQIGKLNEQLELQELSERRKRVYDHLGRLYERDFLLMTVELQALLRNPPRCSWGWTRRWRSKSDEQQALIMAVLNFYEIVAGEYNGSDKLLDRDIADKALAPVLDQIWVKARPFVRWLRKRYVSKEAYQELECMHRARKSAKRAS